MEEMNYCLVTKDQSTCQDTNQKNIFQIALIKFILNFLALEIILKNIITKRLMRTLLFLAIKIFRYTKFKFKSYI